MRNLKLLMLCAAVLFQSSQALAYYGVAPGDEGDLYVGLGGGFTTFNSRDWIYGARNNGTDALEFETEQSGVMPEIFGGMIFKSPVKDSLFTKFRIFGSAQTGSSDIQNQNVATGTTLPNINGAFNWSFPNWQSTNILRSEYEIMNIRAGLATDIAIGQTGLFVVPSASFNYTNLKQTFNFTSTPSVAGLGFGTTIIETLQTTYYGVDLDLTAAYVLNDMFSIHAGAGMSFMQATSDFDGNQTTTGVVTLQTGTGKISQTDNTTSQNTQFHFGAAMHSFFGTFQLIYKIINFQYVPYIENPTSTTVNSFTSAGLGSDKLTQNSIGLNYSYAFNLL